ncbi:CocE/NonD family hydrolase [Streptomyces olivoreticuli]|uniref:CocE/NonD family hydrolase n=1 Tax=Streptomyces olivoreticuli TaxID=68246 RepID=UPI00265AE001|nr:CocE/NonD family hydrolase [Streptomyces olivoreticuli]WKK24358.1 CocE/NonD family hydrolase [Streptomyces olivoreticuli]
MQIRTAFPYETTCEDVRIPLPDGTRLYARIWRPVTEEPVPVLLEYLPYRLGEWTAPRDAQRHPWYAGHGYASVRVDIRGHGNSEGLPGDEYDATELADGVAVVNWLAAQPWCTGKVGMFGISWGGFNALQIAALAPEPLKAIVTVCSTDDRYDNDVHYMGGSVLGVDMHAWAATMLAFTCRPPDPAHLGEEWRPLWLKRLETLQPPIHTWLAHQTRDAYWRHGSVCEDYSAVRAAVLAVGGWHDPYRDTVLRLVEHLPGPAAGLIGPWSHQYPDRGLPPGPAFPFGNDADLPPDQRDEDAKSACFDFPVPKDGPVEILGRPRVRLRLRSHAPRGQVVARLCDVAPDGSSTLVTRGALNLSARHGRDRVEPWPEGAVEDVQFELNAIGHAFPPGHRIRLAVSSAYWPWIWPQPGSAGFTLHPDGSTLELPVRTPTTDTITFAGPEQSAPLNVVLPEPEQQRPERRIVRDVAAGTWHLEVDPRYGGTRVHPDGLEFTEDALETYTVHERDPLSARTRSDWTIRLHRPGLGWDVMIRTRSEITADAEDFVTANEVTCREGDEIVFHRTWDKRIPRTAG